MPRGHRIMYSRSLCPGLHEKSAPQLDEATLSGTLGMRTALRLYNRAAFSYLLHPERDDADAWLNEAFDIWHKDVTAEMDEGSLPFELVGVPSGEFSHLAIWVRQGMDAQKAKNVTVQADLDGLLVRHRRLCNVVIERARGPPQEWDSTILDGWDGSLLCSFHPTLIPTCRAVLLLGHGVWRGGRRVVLVLTGDNEQLASGAPSFDSISVALILSRPRDDMVEVSLQTAVEFLRGLKDREEAANKDLQRLSDMRRASIMSRLRDEAWDAVDAAVAEGMVMDGTFQLSFDVQFAAQAVLPHALTGASDDITDREVGWRTFPAKQKEAIHLLRSEARLRRTAQGDKIEY